MPCVVRYFIPVFFLFTGIESGHAQCTCREDIANLIQNGDFEDPNTTTNAPVFSGFESDYSAVGSTTYMYGFFRHTTNANLFHPDWCNTPGTNRYLVFDGTALNTNLAVPPYDVLRYVNIPVVPGQVYRFSYDVMNNIRNQALAQIEVRVNGTLIGTDIIGNDCLPFITRSHCWTANSGTATITVNAGLAEQAGRDFSIDNVFFGTCVPDTVINKYAAVLGYDECYNILTVDSAQDFHPGDTVLMIQMKGAVADTANTANFGNILAYNRAGNYEFNVIRDITGNQIALWYEPEHNYDIPEGKVQLVRVPVYDHYEVNLPHSALPWNGVKGGVFAIHVQDTLTLNQSIDVSGQGFRGGTSNTALSFNIVCNITSYFSPPNMDTSAQKGEGIAEVSVQKSYGRGKLANGGGGGNAHNAGGGGGSNGSVGGMGGANYNGCVASGTNVWGGVGGTSLTYNLPDRIFMGGGGGAGHTNQTVQGDGGNGGGIIFIVAGEVVGNGGKLISSGADAPQCALPVNTTNIHCGEGMGGGGGGGSIILDAGAYRNNIPVLVKGGNGADVKFPDNASNSMRHGPGGGGSGGIIWVRQGATPPDIQQELTAGISGMVLSHNTNWGAMPGEAGRSLTGFATLFASDTFGVKLPVVDLGPDTAVCSGTLPLVLRSSQPAGSIYQWSNGTAADSLAVYVPGSYWLKVISGGCVAADTVAIGTKPSPVVDLGRDTAICDALLPLVLRSSQPAGSSYQWSDGTTADSLAVHAAGRYWLQVSSGGCIAADSIQIGIVPSPAVELGPDTVVCAGALPLILHASQPAGSIYQWSNGTAADSLAVYVPGSYWLKVISGGCVAADTVAIGTKPSPVVDLGRDTAICDTDIPLLLHAPQPAGSTYLWSNGLADTQMLVTSGGRYWLQVSRNGCIGADTISIQVTKKPVLDIGQDSIICAQYPLRIGMEIPGAAYEWSTGSTAPYINVSGTGRYVLRISLDGCQAADTVHITAMPPPEINLGPDLTLCPGAAVSLQGPEEDGATYTWNTGATTRMIEARAAGLYILNMISAYQCTAADSIRVLAGHMPEVQLGNDTLVCTGTRLMLSAYHTYTDTLVWSDGTTGDVLHVIRPGVYSISGVNSCGEDTDSIAIEMVYCRLLLPDAFSPNGDGLNDIFRVIGSIGMADDFLFSIYNRWGECVFTTGDKYQGWDGRYKGVAAPVGTYFYLVKFSIGGAKEIKKGDFQLLR